MKQNIQCNAMEVYEKFSSLAKEEMTKAMKSAVRSGAMKLKKETVSIARGGIKTYNNHPGGKYENGNILDAVMVTKMETRANEDISMKVHVLGNRKTGSKTFRFRFLEGGTKDRYATKYKGAPLKKQRYLGRIAPRRYFGQAKRNILPAMDSIFIEKINECINKVNNTKF